jgi:hypothetical protein
LDLKKDGKEDLTVSSKIDVKENLSGSKIEGKRPDRLICQEILLDARG